ncbi:MAG: inorganic diphosphatase [Cupriavidus sp.]|nr:MAG: inorganic diphosphatase [Cupriavidus sp.]
MRIPAALATWIAIPALTLASLAWAQEPPSQKSSTLNPFDYPQPASAPRELMAVIEIPQGGINKYEIDHDSGLLILNRVLTMPAAYPANYGAFPQTSAGDGDPLDLVLFTRAPVQAGALVLVRPIGVLRMLDAGEQDDKIICVPAHSVDPTYDAIEALENLPQAERDRLETFFRIYKDLPHGSKKVELKGFGDADEARSTIRQALVAGAERGSDPGASKQISFDKK